MNGVVLQCLDGRGDHRIGRAKVGLADLHLHDMPALGLQFLGAVPDFHHLERLDFRHSAS